MEHFSLNLFFFLIHLTDLLLGEIRKGEDGLLLQKYNY